MNRLQSATARHINSYGHVDTRKHATLHIETWFKYCGEVGCHPLEVSAANCQRFMEWLSERYSPASAVNRMYGVRKWLDFLVKDKLIRAHGMHLIDIPPVPAKAPIRRVVTEDEVDRLVAAAAALGPRWEWLMGMMVYCAVDVPEALKVRSTDVRTWEGRTLVRVRASNRLVREIPVNGRLEVLTLGLAAVFAPTTNLFGRKTLRPIREKLGETIRGTLGRTVTTRELCESAIRRQYERGVELPVLAKWLGLVYTDSLEAMLGIGNPVEDVSQVEMVEAIVVENDPSRFG